MIPPWHLLIWRHTTAICLLRFYMAFGLLLGSWAVLLSCVWIAYVLCMFAYVLCVYCVQGSWLIVFAALTGEKLSVVRRGLKFMAVAEKEARGWPLILAYLPFHEHNPFQILEHNLVRPDSRGRATHELDKCGEASSNSWTLIERPEYIIVVTNDFILLILPFLRLNYLYASWECTLCGLSEQSYSNSKILQWEVIRSIHIDWHT